MNNVHDRVFDCPKCGNMELVPVYPTDSPVGIGYHELCICEECCAELYTEPQCDLTVKFVELPKEEE